MTDIDTTRSSQPPVGLRLERQQRQHAIDVSQHRLGAAGPPRPDAGTDVIDDRQSRQRRPDTAGDAMSEVRAVDDNEDIGPVGDDHLSGPADARHKGRQPGQHRQDAHDGDVADRKQAFEALGLHSLATDAGEDDVARPCFAERPHELEAELVARVFAGDESHAQWVHPAGSGYANPATNRPAAAALRAQSARSSTSTRPAAIATPRSCALTAPSIVFGPTAGMSSLRSCPRLGAFTRTPARPARRSRPSARISATRASMASVPSAASIASTRPAATTAPCPASKVDNAPRSDAPSAMSVSSSSDGARAPMGPNAARRQGAISCAPTTRTPSRSMIAARPASSPLSPRRNSCASPAALLTAPQSSLRSASSGLVIAPIITISAIARSFSAAKSLPTSPIRTHTWG